MPKEKLEECQRVSIEDAAREIGCHPQYLRVMMMKKKWNLGQVVSPQKKGGKHMYFIFRKKLDEFLGIESGKEHETVCE